MIMLLDILSYRDYSRKDMELKLKRKGADAGIIKSTIQKLLEYGFLDEKRYGQRVFEAWLSKKILWQMSPAAGAAEKKCGRTLYKRYFSAVF